MTEGLSDPAVNRYALKALARRSTSLNEKMGPYLKKRKDKKRPLFLALSRKPTLENLGWKPAARWIRTIRARAKIMGRAQGIIRIYI